MITGGTTFREPYDGHQGCEACGHTSWLAFTKEITSALTGETRRYPWSGACYCPRGVWLTQPREPKPNTGAGKPILATHAPREEYARKLGMKRAA